MAQPHFSLSWHLYKQSICSGLSALQQNGEFVDMTLAADGHHVKVHQMVMSLVSPYIKELLSSIQCTHPVIFLNKMSHATLCAILEYIYTGEVLVMKENLPALIEAAKELRIKGLEDMKVEVSHPNSVSQTMLATSNEGRPLTQTGYFKKSQRTDKSTEEQEDLCIPTYKISRSSNKESGSELTTMVIDDVDEQSMDDSVDQEYDDDVIETEQNEPQTNVGVTSANKNKIPDTQIQYTISNQGALQMILNRFMYYLRYTSRKSSNRQWRCMDYTNKHKCPATMITKDNVVVKRFGVHNHPFHDQRILKKARENLIYSAMHDAEAMGLNKKQMSKMLPERRKKDTITDTV
ncbi:modifier of mdg4-like [Pectinophora gossypiella]|uniref:modifier of mdg4-like n=1 Tax=Pectinophora gossypiella TaxID=13191 RepID=UPI00214F0663|nr:modifier of mdg4-like [Pectinophora gossypiella]